MRVQGLHHQKMTIAHQQHLLYPHPLRGIRHCHLRQQLVHHHQRNQRFHHLIHHQLPNLPHDPLSQKCHHQEKPTEIQLPGLRSQHYHLNHQQVQAHHYLHQRMKVFLQRYHLLEYLTARILHYRSMLVQGHHHQENRDQLHHLILHLLLFHQLRQLHRSMQLHDRHHQKLNFLRIQSPMPVMKTVLRHQKMNQVCYPNLQHQSHEQHRYYLFRQSRFHQNYHLMPEQFHHLQMAETPRQNHHQRHFQHLPLE